MAASQFLSSFNAGELSPLLDARTDIAKYVSGSRILENFIPTPYGPNMRRPGTETGGETKDSTKQSRLIPFVFSETAKYVLELGDEYLRVWDSDAILFKGTPPDFLAGTSYVVGDYVWDGRAGEGIWICTADCIGIGTHPAPAFVLIADGDYPYVTDLPTPFSENEIRDVQLVQINDIIYFTHPNHPPQKFIRTFATNSSVRIVFQIEETTWTWPAMLDENSDSSAAITPSGTTGSITLSGTGLFYSSQVGAYFQIAHIRASSTVAKTFAANGSSSSIGAIGSWSVNTYGVWAGTLTIERSYDGGSNWAEIRSYTATSDRNVVDTGVEYRNCLLRLTFSNRTVGTAADRALLTLDDSKFYGLVKITAFTDADTVDATVISDLYSTNATSYWSEGAWSDYQGYPRAIAVHDDRVYYAGTARQPQSIWGTQIDDFQNFRTGTLASDGLFFTIASNRTSIIQWLQSKDGYLHVGRLGSEGRLGSADPTATLSPEDITWTPTTAYGSKHMASVILNDALLFVQGQGRKVRTISQISGNAANPSFSAADLSVLSEHITKGEIVEFAAQTLPDAILWCIRGDGVLIGMSYDSLSSVVAWHRHSTAGEFESVAVIPGTYGDQVWFVVKRTINGVTKRFVERFRPGWRETWENEDKNEWWYLDCAKRVVNDPPAALVSGLDHLEGETVRVLSDGADLGEYTVASGAITLSVAGGINIVGLSYASNMLPMKLVQQYQNGSTRARKARVANVNVQVLKSLGMKISTDGVNYDAGLFRAADNNLDESPPVETGIVNVTAQGNYTEDGPDIYIRQDAPMPLTVVAVTPIWEAGSN